MVNHNEILGKDLRKWIKDESENRPTAVAKLINVLLDKLHLSDVAFIDTEENKVNGFEVRLVGKTLTAAMKLRILEEAERKWRENE